MAGGAACGRYGDDGQDALRRLHRHLDDGRGGYEGAATAQSGRPQADADQDRAERYEGEAGWASRHCDLACGGGGDERRDVGEGNVPVYEDLSASAVGALEDYKF